MVCDEGEYLDFSWFTSSCELCPAGFACPHWTKGGKYKCRTGEFSDEGWHRCQPCPVGHYCPNGMKNGCEPGLFQPDTRATSCLRCEEGFWSAGMATGRPFLKIQTVT